MTESSRDTVRIEPTERRQDENLCQLAYMGGTIAMHFSHLSRLTIQSLCPPPQYSGGAYKGSENHMPYNKYCNFAQERNF
jgi:hypothetical protein